MNLRRRRNGRPYRRPVENSRGAKPFLTLNFADVSAMNRALEWTPAAERDLRRLDHPMRGTCPPGRLSLRGDRPGRCAAPSGIPREWRLPVGDWRIRFTEDPTAKPLSSYGYAAEGKRIAKSTGGGKGMTRALDWQQYDQLKAQGSADQEIAWH